MPSQTSAINAAATASAAAVHITRRYASTTATDATSEADVPPNANQSATTATRPLSRAAALFTTPDAEPPQVAGRGAQDHRRKRRYARGHVDSGQHKPRSARTTTEHNNAVALADYLAAH